MNPISHKDFDFSGALSYAVLVSLGLDDRVVISLPRTSSFGVERPRVHKQITPVEIAPVRRAEKCQFPRPTVSGVVRNNSIAHPPHSRDGEGRFRPWIARAVMDSPNTMPGLIDDHAAPVAFPVPRERSYLIRAGSGFGMSCKGGRGAPLASPKPSHEYRHHSGGEEVAFHDRILRHSQVDMQSVPIPSGVKQGGE